MVLVMDTSTNMKHKHGANLFIIRRHYKRQTVKLIQLDTMTLYMTPNPALEGSNNSGERSLLSRLSKPLRNDYSLDLFI